MNGIFQISDQRITVSEGFLTFSNGSYIWAEKTANLFLLEKKLVCTLKYY